MMSGAMIFLHFVLRPPSRPLVFRVAHRTRVIELCCCIAVDRGRGHRLLIGFVNRRHTADASFFLLFLGRMNRLSASVSVLAADRIGCDVLISHAHVTRPVTSTSCIRCQLANETN